MKLSEVSIQRPVFATVMSLSIILFGVIAFTRLPVREYPDIDPPVVSITTFYRGASPSVVETEITDILEEQLATLEGVKTIQSSSLEQGSSITVEFELSRNVEEAANDVRDKVSRVRGQLPKEADDPIVAKVDVNAQPIFWIALSSTKHNGSSIAVRSPSSPSTIASAFRSGLGVTASIAPDPALVSRRATSTESQNRFGSSSPRSTATHAALSSRPASPIQARSSDVLPLPAGADTSVTRRASARRSNSSRRATMPGATCASAVSERADRPTRPTCSHHARTADLTNTL